MALITRSNVKKLASRIVRERLRKTEPHAKSKEKEKSWLDQALSSIGRKLGIGVNRFLGWGTSQLLNLTAGLFVSAWDTIVSAGVELISFDFGQSDAEMNAQIKRNNQAMLAALAGGVGRLLGLGLVRLATLSIGGLVGISSKVKSALSAIKIPVLSSRIGAELASTGSAALREELSSFLLVSRDAVASNLLIWGTLHARRNQWFGLKSIKEASTTDGSIAATWQRKVIDKLPEFWRPVANAAVEGFFGGVIEGGYVVARNFDDAVIEARYARRASEEQLTVEIFVDGANQEPLTINGTRDEIEEAIPTAMALHGQGAAIPAPIDQALRPGSRRPQLVVVYSKEGQTGQYRIVIPHYNGGKNPSLPSIKAGRYQGYWVLNDGSKLVCYADSSATALSAVKRLGAAVNPRFKIGTEPMSKESSRKVAAGLLRPKRAYFYPEGKGGKMAWSVDL